MADMQSNPSILGFSSILCMERCSLNEQEELPQEYVEAKGMILLAHRT